MSFKLYDSRLYKKEHLLTFFLDLSSSLNPQQVTKPPSEKEILDRNIGAFKFWGVLFVCLFVLES